jgi:hypothetical protein
MMDREDRKGLREETMSRTGYKLRHIVDRLAPGAAYFEPLPALNRVLYCHEGSFVVVGKEDETVGEDRAWFGSGSVTVKAGENGAVIWRYELAGSDAPAKMAAGTGVSSVLTLESEIEGPDPSGDWILRCDGVKFPMGGQAFSHIHQGPGIRCLREGKIRIETAGRSKEYQPGDAWFEPGPEPVFAQACSERCTSFVRVMVLPAELRGKSSIQYINPDDIDKPKSQRYQHYVDEPIEH